jgi:hypothetical protein
VLAKNAEALGKSLDEIRAGLEGEGEEGSREGGSPGAEGDSGTD